MLISYRFIQDLTGLTLSEDEMSDKLTSLGLEVDSISRLDLDPLVVVAEVRHAEKHPTKDNLTVVRVWNGECETQVVCGASNVPPPGGLVLFAQLGAKLKLANGTVLEMAPRKLAGVDSFGMLCAEDELGLSDDHDGIWVYDETTFREVVDIRAGLPASDLPFDDIVFEIGLTPNRPDCLGHRGVARDLCADGRAFEVHAIEQTAEPVAAVQIQIDDAQRSPRFSAQRVSGVTNGASPFWLRHRLHRLGVRSISRLVDVTNWVMLETGHPIHGFDVSKLPGTSKESVSMEVRLARKEEMLTTLDGAERKLTDDDIVVCSGGVAVALAGVMGGSSSEMDAGSHDILLECAYFDPRSIRRTSRRTGLHTDASHRFERGVDPNDAEQVLQLASSMMVEVAGGKAHQMADQYPSRITAKRINFVPAHASALLGFDVSSKPWRRVLEGLGCVVEGSDNEVSVLAPTWRPDLTRSVDLIEEVGRVLGYEHIEASIPRVVPSSRSGLSFVRFERHLREAAAAAGLHEAISLSFAQPGDERWLEEGLRPVVLQNPLSADRPQMRSSLLPGLCRAAAHALGLQAPTIRLFEVGRAFWHGQGKMSGRQFHLDSSDADADIKVLPCEQAMFAALVVGEQLRWRGKAEEVELWEDALGFFDLKGQVEALATSLSLKLSFRRPTVIAPSFHPARVAEILAHGEVVGVMGELHPDVAETFSLSSRRPCYAELDLQKVYEVVSAFRATRAIEPGRFPAVLRDFAFVVEESLSVQSLEQAIAQGAGELFEHVALFDVFRGDSVGAGRKSVAVRVRFRDREATLSDARIESVTKAVVDAAREQCGAELRIRAWLNVTLEDAKSVGSATVSDPPAKSD